MSSSEVFSIICAQNYCFQTNTFVKYTDGTPFAYQVWNNYLIKNQRLQIIPRQQNKYYEQKNFTKHFQKSYVEKVIIAQRKLQPDSQLGSSCVVLVTAILTEPDWITVPCYEKFSDLIMCQKTLNHPTDKSSKIYNMQPNAMWCAEGHLFFGNKCILLQQYQKLTNVSNLHYQMKNRKPFAKIHVPSYVNDMLKEYFSLIQHILFSH